MFRTRQAGSHRCLDRIAILGAERGRVLRRQALVRVVGCLVPLQAHVPVLPAVRIRGDAHYLGIRQTSAGRRPERGADRAPRRHTEMVDAYHRDARSRGSIHPEEDSAKGCQAVVRDQGLEDRIGVCLGLAQGSGDGSR
jgi:hypothetical protein